MNQPDASAGVTAAPRCLPMFPLRVAAVGGLAVVVLMAGLQVVRLTEGRGRSTLLMYGPLLFLAITAVATLAWTYVAVANIRRLALARVTITPVDAAASWALPFAVAALASAAVFALQLRLEDSAREESPLPLAVALGALIVTMLVAYRPVGVIAQALRSIGGVSIRLARWYWVPVVIAIVGTASLFAMSALGLFDEALADGATGVEGLVPLWALGVVAIPPSVVVLGLAWNGAASVEWGIHFAHDKRTGRTKTGAGRGRVGLLARALRADARPAIARDRRKLIRLIPGADLLRGALVALASALALVSIVGALVMFLFWREAQDGIVPPVQRGRAWDALAALRDIERVLAAGVVALAVVWTLVVVANIRLATGRRRNPFLAAAAWPAAAWGVIWLAQRTDGAEVSEVVWIFLGQAVVTAVPFFLLSRAAISVGGQVGPIRMVWLLVAVLIVHLQGLGGLSTIGVENDLDRFGTLAGYLSLAALVELIAVIALSESSRILVDGARTERDKHNFLVERTRAIEDHPLPEVPWTSIASLVEQQNAAAQPSTEGDASPAPSEPSEIAVAEHAADDAAADTVEAGAADAADEFAAPGSTADDAPLAPAAVPPVAAEEPAAIDTITPGPDAPTTSTAVEHDSPPSAPAPRVSGPSLPRLDVTDEAPTSTPVSTPAEEPTATAVESESSEDELAPTTEPAPAPVAPEPIAAAPAPVAPEPAPLAPAPVAAAPEVPSEAPVPVVGSPAPAERVAVGAAPTPAVTAVAEPAPVPTSGAVDEVDPDPAVPLTAPVPGIGISTPTPPPPPPPPPLP